MCIDEDHMDWRQVAYQHHNITKHCIDSQMYIIRIGNRLCCSSVSHIILGTCFTVGCYGIHDRGCVNILLGRKEREYEEKQFSLLLQGGTMENVLCYMKISIIFRKNSSFFTL